MRKKKKFHELIYAFQTLRAGITGIFSSFKNATFSGSSLERRLSLVRLAVNDTNRFIINTSSVLIFIHGK